MSRPDTPKLPDMQAKAVADGLAARKFAEADPAFARVVLDMPDDVDADAFEVFAGYETEYLSLKGSTVDARKRLEVFAGEVGIGLLPEVHQGTIHDSRSPSKSGIVNDADEGAAGLVIELWAFEKPDPLRWAVDQFIPHGFASVLAADGGIGKSFLALYLCVCVALGLPFFGLATERRRVLYVDYELDQRVHKHRLFRVLKGMGLTPDEPYIAEYFYYIRPERYLPSGAPDVARVVNELDIGLVILDSLTLASIGDVTDAQDTTSLMREFRSWGTVLALDHVSGATARGNAANARPFGSVFKRNLARATFSLAKAEGGGYILRPDKNNFAAPQDLVCFKHEFDGAEGSVKFTRLDATADEMVGVHEHMRPNEVTHLAVSKLYDDVKRNGAPVTAEDVVTWLDEHDLPVKKVGTIRNHLTALCQNEKIWPAGEKGFIPIPDSEKPSVKEDTEIAPNTPEGDIPDSHFLSRSGIGNEVGGNGVAGGASETLPPAPVPTGDGSVMSVEGFEREVDSYSPEDPD